MLKKWLRLVFPCLQHGFTGDGTRTEAWWSLQASAAVAASNREGTLKDSSYLHITQHMTILISSLPYLVRFFPSAPVPVLAWPMQSHARWPWRSDGHRPHAEASWPAPWARPLPRHLPSSTTPSLCQPCPSPWVKSSVGEAIAVSQICNTVKLCLSWAEGRRII